MKLTEKALHSINNQITRLTIAQTLPCSETWVRRLIEQNKDNGPLTTMAVLKVIRKETGLRDSEILESETADKSAA
jgi:hypothetical protein